MSKTYRSDPQDTEPLTGYAAVIAANLREIAKRSDRVVRDARKGTA